MLPASRRLSFTLAILLLVATVGLYAIFSTKQKAGNYTVHLKANAEDQKLTDVYLYDAASGKETKFISLSNVDRDLYHPAEFAGGNLYIIRRFGLSDDHPADPNWTDELWKYQDANHGAKLHSAQSLDFRVSSDAGNIGIVTGAFPNETVVLLDPKGNLLKTFGRSDLGITDPSSALEPLFWDRDTFWLATRQARELIDLISLNATNFSHTKRNLSALGIVGNEFALKTEANILAFSDYVSPLEVEHNVTAPYQSASLYLYDLSAGKKTKLLTASVNKPFAPAWLDDTTLEYNDPNGTGRIRIQAISSFSE